MLMMNKDNLNKKLPYVYEDSGWKIKFEGACYTTWQRVFKLANDSKVEDIVKYLKDNKDYPGQSVSYAPGYSKGDKVAIVSTYDSSG